MVLVAAALMIVGPNLMSWLAAQVGLQHGFVPLWTWLRWPVAILLLIVAVSVVYHVAPDTTQRFRLITPGAVLAVVVWIAASLGFGYYVQSFANYNATYGSMVAIVVLLFYFYLSAAVLLVGAEVNAQVTQGVAADRLPQEASPERQRTSMAAERER